MYVQPMYNTDEQVSARVSVIRDRSISISVDKSKVIIISKTFMQTLEIVTEKEDTCNRYEDLNTWWKDWWKNKLLITKNKINPTTSIRYNGNVIMGKTEVTAGLNKTVYLPTLLYEITPIALKIMKATASQWNDFLSRPAG